MSSRSSVLSLGVLAWVAAGCSSPATETCTPGLSVACVGPAGCSGGQTCDKDGTGYLQCQCGPSPDGGMGGGTATGGGVGGGSPLGGGTGTGGGLGGGTGGSGGGSANPCASVTCNALSQCHNVGTCNPSTGVCSNPLKTNGSPCNDNDLCTSGDTCNSSGSCVGTPKNCGAAPDGCHLAGVCGAAGVCSFPPNTGAVCTPSDACYADGICSSGGTCASGFKDCSDGNPCTYDGCSGAGVCNHTALGDGSTCATNMVCNGGVCASCLAGVACTPANSCHTGITSCVTGVSICLDTGTKADNTPCNDNNACTQGDWCVAGSCSGHNSVLTTCPPPAACQVPTGSTCNPATGCFTNLPENTACGTAPFAGLCRSGICTLGVIGASCSGSSEFCSEGTCDTTVHRCVACGATGQLCCATANNPAATHCRLGLPSQWCCAAASGCPFVFNNICQ